MEQIPSFAQLDEQPLKAFHWRSIVTTGMGVFADGYDLSAIGIVLPLVLTSFGVAHVSSIQGAMLAGSALIGAALGAMIFGLLGQRGRKTFYGLDVTIMAIAAVAQVFVPDLWWLIGVRFILGIGVGADYVLSPTIMSEYANRSDRGRALGFGFGVMWPSGTLAAALLVLALQGAGIGPDLVWRIVLAAGAVPALSVLYLRRRMPETARYLARLADDQPGAAAVVREVAGEPAAPLPGVDRRELWHVLRRHGRPILAAALLWMVYDIVVYSTILFGPSLIAEGLGLGPVVFAIIAALFFSIPGAVAAALLADRVGRKVLMGGCMALGAIMLFLFAGLHTAVVASPLLGMTFFGIYNIAMNGPGVVTSFLGAELSPTRLRTIGQSISVVGGRTGASISAFLFPLIFARIGLYGAIMTLAAIAVLGAILSMTIIPETRGRSLEEINDEALDSTILSPGLVPATAER
jgi:MFS family permease